MIDIDGGRAVVHTRPGADGYARVETIGAEGELTAPDLGIDPSRLADVLAAARRLRGGGIGCDQATAL